MRRRKQIERSNKSVDPADCPKPRIDDCGAYSVSTYSVEPTALATRHKNHENASRLFLVLEHFLDERKKFEAYEYELAGYRLRSSLSLFDCLCGRKSSHPTSMSHTLQLQSTSRRHKNHRLSSPSPQPLNPNCCLVQLLLICQLLLYSSVSALQLTMGTSALKNVWRLAEASV